MLYYFLSDKNFTFISGPFITVTNTPNEYVGQIVRSNDFSIKQQNNNLDLDLCLWVCDFDSNLTNQQIKKELIKLLPNLENNENIKFITNFDSKLNYSSGPYPSLTIIQNNVKYVLEFKCLYDILHCPTLYIYF